jgi:hypothetical protein
MSRIRRLVEGLAGKPRGLADILPSIFRGEARLEASLEDLERFYREDPVAHSAVDMYVELIVGSGYYTVAEDQKAKDVVDGFAERVDMDSLLRESVRSMLIYGDAFVEKVWSGSRLIDLRLLPSRTVKIKRNEYGGVEAYIQTARGRTVEFKPDEIMHLRYNPVGTSAYGLSLLYPVVGLLKAKREAVENMGMILARYAAPKIIWRVPSQPALKQLQSILEGLKPDEDIIIAGDVDFKPVTVDPRARFEFYYEYLDRQIFEGLQAPLLSWLRNATEASARAMLDTVDRRVAGMQRYLKRRIEAEVFKPLIEAEGLSEVPRLYWGLPRTKLDEVTLDDVANLVRSLVLDPGEARRWLARMGFPVEVSESIGRYRVFRARWMEDIDEIYLLLSDPGDADPASMRYVPVDSERGIYMVVAYSRSAGVRIVYKIGFEKAKGWTIDDARRWYESSFPRVYEKLRVHGCEGSQNDNRC